MEQQDAPDLSDVPEGELAEALADEFMANDLRKWMSANGFTRSRGANKAESARQAVQQDREGIARFLFERGAIDVDWERRCEYHEVCGNTTPAAGQEICDECTDLSRRNSRERDPVDIGDFDSRLDYMRELHARYD